MFLWKALWLVQLFSGDVWMIKITIKTNQIVRLDVCFFQKQITYKNRLSPKVQLFSISLLVCKRNPRRKTWFIHPWEMRETGNNDFATWLPLSPVFHFSYSSVLPLLQNHFSLFSLSIAITELLINHTVRMKAIDKNLITMGFYNFCTVLYFTGNFQYKDTWFLARQSIRTNL